MKYYTFVCAAPRLRITVLPGEQPADITDGYGGWEVVKRPRNLAFTRWEGSNPYQMSFGIILNGYPNRLVTTEFLALERMARDPGGDAEPPVIQVVGPHPRGDQVPWVIESLDWDDGSIMRNSYGQLMRIAAVVTLRQYVSPDLIKLSAAKRRKKKAKPKKHRPWWAPARVNFGNSVYDPYSPIRDERVPLNRR